MKIKHVTMKYPVYSDIKKVFHQVYCKFLLLPYKNCQNPLLRKRCLLCWSERQKIPRRFYLKVGQKYNLRQPTVLYKSSIDFYVQYLFQVRCYLHYFLPQVYGCKIICKFVIACSSRIVIKDNKQLRPDYKHMSISSSGIQGHLLKPQIELVKTIAKR